MINIKSLCLLYLIYPTSFTELLDIRVRTEYNTETFYIEFSQSLSKADIGKC